MKQFREFLPEARKFKLDPKWEKWQKVKSNKEFRKMMQKFSTHGLDSSGDLAKEVGIKMDQPGGTVGYSDNDVVGIWFDSPKIGYIQTRHARYDK